MREVNGIQSKYVTVRKFGWKRVAKNIMRFGWELEDATKETTFTENTSYTGTVTDDKIYITPHTTTSSKTRINLSFKRNRMQFYNLGAIAPLEIFHNLFYFVRMIIGTVLPFLFAGFMLFSIFGMQMDSYGSVETKLTMYFFLIVGVWLLLIIVENILAKISAHILLFKESKK